LYTTYTAHETNQYMQCPMIANGHCFIITRV